MKVAHQSRLRSVGLVPMYLHASATSAGTALVRTEMKSLHAVVNVERGAVLADSNELAVKWLAAHRCARNLGTADAALRSKDAKRRTSRRSAARHHIRNDAATRIHGLRNSVVVIT